MKKLLALLLLVLLAGCVSYYQPESALEDGVYYAEDDPAYNYNPDDYSGVVYYPWSSLDSFYFGYWPYPGYGFGYGYAYGYPGYFPPWYFPYYHHPSWTSYHKICDFHRRCGGNVHDARDAGDDNYAGNDQQTNGHPAGDGEENVFYSPDGKNKMGRASYPPMKRYVSKTSSGRPGSQDTVAQNRKETKTGISRFIHVYPNSPGSTAERPAASPAMPSPPSASPGNTFSGHNTPSPSFDRPASPPSSNYGKSSHHKDRD